MNNPFTRELKDPETGKWLPKEVWYRVRGAVAVLLSLAVLVGGGWFVWTKGYDAWLSYRTVEDYIDPAGEADVLVEVPEGASTSEISDILVQAGVIKTAKAFDRIAALDENSRKIQYGYFRLRTKVPAKTALAMLLDPKNQVKNQFQIPEGMRLSQVLPLLARVSKVPEKDLRAALKDRDSLGLPGWLAKSNEGFIFPDTYNLPPKPTARNVLRLATRQFTRVTDDLAFDSKANNLGYKPSEALVVASIIEREVFRDEDRDKVARVFYNRLEKKMPLQSDATVAYANKLEGRIFTTPKERQLDSKYNTYKYRGLPPGPITAPARRALEAAVNPADGSWLYFMPINLDTGETVFSNTFAEHQQASAKLQQWCLASAANRKKCNG
jgi:UPF0755 protein